MNQNENNPLKDFITGTLNYLSFFKRNILWLLLSVILCAAAFGGYAYYSGAVYRAERTFVVNAGEGNSSIELPTLGAGFGFGGKMYKISSLEKILMLSKSEKVIFGMLLTKIPDSEDLVCNRIIDVYSLEKEKISEQKFDDLSITEKSTLRFLKKLVTSEFVNTSYEDESQFFRISSKTKDEQLSFYLTNLIYERLVGFYVQNSIKKSKDAVNTLETRRDSIGAVLKKGEYQLAVMRDQGSNYIHNTTAINRYRKKREVEFNTQLYIEVENLLEIARYKLEGVTPILTTIDKPFFPLKLIKKPLISSLLLGALIGALIAIIMLILVKSYRDIMNS